MNDGKLAFHYVCTRGEARKLVDSRSRFWVSNCGCREDRGECDRSRMDVCLMFRGDVEGSGGSGRKEISRAEVEEILREAESKHLVTRPFRNETDMTTTDGICFCCDDCCEYFVDPGENICDRGYHVERTESDGCLGCGECVQVCYFGARRLHEESLVVDRTACYGCGLCVDVCPEGCIGMIPRS